MKTPDIMKSKYWFLVIPVLLIACHKPVKDFSRTEKARIRVVRINRQKMMLPVIASGLIVSDKEVKLSFKTGGIIAALYADDGNVVKQGTLLATLNLSEIEAQVEQATNGFQKATRDYNRAKNLYTDSVATLEQLQNAETAMNVAKANYEIATFNLQHSRITAPADGVILKRLAETNEVVGPGYPVFIFGTSGKYWKIKAGVSDRNYVRLKQGDPARVTLDAYPGDTLKAVVSQVGESANPMTGTYEIELDLLPVNKKLASGFVANLEIYPAAAGTYFKIPVESIVEAEGTTGYVFAVSDSLVVKKTKVEIAGIYETWAAVSGDLGEADQIATEGAAYISDGETVTLAR